MRPETARRTLSVLLTILALGVGSTAASATDWTGLRGPNSDGGVDDVSLFPGAAGALEIGWKVPLGSGYSSIVVGGGRAITMFQEAGVDLMAAFDTETGAELWRYRIADGYAGHDGSHDGPIASPALGGGRVFGFGPRGHLFALDAESGEELWARDLVEEEGAAKPHYGFASSPVLAGDVLVVEMGAEDGGTVAGFAAATGELEWKLGDDAVAYHSPVRATLAGRDQVVAAGSTMAIGIDPESGEALWSFDHEGDRGAMGGQTIVPVPAGDDRVFLMNHMDSSVMIRIHADGGGYRAEELWKNNSLKTSYVVPVAHEGYVYGISGRVLTCVDAETGERKWRSRAPGDGFPIRVGNHLVILTKPGSLHVADASPEGFSEVASLELFDEHSWTEVAFADGSLYARSMGHLARIDPRRQASLDAESASWVAATGFGGFLAELEEAKNKDAAIEAYLSRFRSMPIVEPSGAVHFVYRGEAEDVGIVGDLIGFRREDPMVRVPGTDLFHYSTRLEPNAAVTYGFIPSFGDVIPDPENPNSAEGIFGEVSFLSMPAWRPSEIFEGSEAARNGRLEDLEYPDPADAENTLKARVYLPAIYDEQPDRRFPTLYFHGGTPAMLDDLRTVLDAVMGDRLEPIVVVLAAGEGSEEGGFRDPRASATLVADTLVPLVDEHYRTQPDRMARGVAGVATAATSAALNAFGRGDLFGRAAMRSPMVLNFSDIAGAVSSADENPLVLYLGWGRYGLRSPHEAWDMVDNSRRFFELLRERGYAPAGGESAEGPTWTTWRGHLADWLEVLFPVSGP